VTSLYPDLYHEHLAMIINIINDKWLLCASTIMLHNACKMASNALVLCLGCGEDITNHKDNRRVLQGSAVAQTVVHVARIAGAD